MLILGLLALPLITAALPLIGRKYDPRIAAAGVLSSGLQFAVSVGLAWACLDGPPPSWGPGQFLRVDALSAVLILTISGVAWISTWYGLGFLHRARERKTIEDAALRRYCILVPLFVFSMLLSVTSNNVGVMWVALEASTIVTALLVGLHQSKSSLEASWKYILLGSVGIALAFVGTVLGYFNFVHRVGQTEFALHWTVLSQVAGRLNGEALRLAFVFLLIGYGTKAGLAPMHTWLPDAHAEAPAPVSAMMSGALLAVALHAIARWKVVVDRCVGPDYSNHMLLLVAGISLVLSALLLARQQNFKRMLAYSSVEHMGLTCLGLGLGPLGTLGALLHLWCHAAAKCVAFLVSGTLLERYGTTRTNSVRGVLRLLPVSGGLYGAALLALLGMPPFGMFTSKLLLLQAVFSADHPWIAGLFLAATAVIFTSVVGYLRQMLSGHPPEGVAAGNREWPQALPLALGTAVLLVLGVAIPQSLLRLLRQAVELLQ